MRDIVALRFPIVVWTLRGDKRGEFGPLKRGPVDRTVAIAI